VANNLNDISKDHPDLILELCERWRGKSENTDWITKHACRTLLKAGNSRAMKLFGMGNQKNIRVTSLSLSHSMLHVGEEIQLVFTLHVKSATALKVRLEYAVYYVKTRGKVSRKVFKISERDYGPGEHRIIRRHSFADRSTRKHHPGEHRIAIIVNGAECAGKTLRLEA
jgi:hypothetical protein